MISRSSLKFVKIRNVTMLTVLQLVNFLVLFINCFFKQQAVKNLYILCPLFVWIGLMGGASYVNINH